MIKRTSANVAKNSTNASDYRLVFRSRVHQLIQIGYEQLVSDQFCEQEEPSITGELVRVIDEAIDDPSSPEWIQKFSIHDDPPVNSPGRTGKRRKRIDIRVVSAHSFPRDRFCFEAKRLSENKHVSAYLGSEGLGCFLNGEYASNDDCAGMLGYVQCNIASYWAEKFNDALDKDPNIYSVTSSPTWQDHSFQDGPAHTYITMHSRTKTRNQIDIYHTLLIFTSSEEVD